MTRDRTRTRLDGFRLHALHEGQGEPVVLLHGLSGSSRWWRYTVPGLRDSYRVHVPELIGFGRSRGAVRHPTMPEMAGLVIRWLDAVGIESTHFVGHSMGAQLGVHLAARWPDRIRRLVLSDAAGIPHSLSPAHIAAVGGELIFPRAWGRPSFLATIATDAARAGPRTLIRAIRGILADDIRPLLPRVRSPTLLIWGEHDPFTPVGDGEAIARLLPDSRLVVIEGASHNPMADRPAAFNQELRQFLGDDR
jgi:pimeloyl-ACP methyl ester carboxylesterase